MSVFGAYARYYELLYRDKDYAGEARFVHELLEKHAPGAESVLELGCGAGNHAACLAEMGYRIDGVDRSAEMLEKARARAGSLPPEEAERLAWFEGDIRSFRTGGEYDAVLSLFHVISYLPDNAGLRAAFATAAAHLKPGGVFLFDCWYGPTVLSEPPEVRVKRMEDENIRVTRICEPELLENDNGVIVNYTVFVEDRRTQAYTQLAESHRMRYLFKPEIEAFFAEAGMETVAACEWITGKPLGSHTFAACFAGRKLP